MRRLAATGIALLALNGASALADPPPPLIDPARARHEDTQRLGAELRDLDREPAPGTLPASSPGAASLPEPIIADASVRLEQGIAAYRAREMDRATYELTQASALAPAWSEPYRWLALVEAAHDDCRSALLNISIFLSRVPAGDPRVPELIQQRDRCLRTGSLLVESAPDGATIRIDGGPPVGRTTQRITLRPGSHTVTLERPGFLPMSRQVDVDPFHVRRAHFDLAAGQQHRPEPRRWWELAVLGVGAVAAAAVVTAAVADSL